MYPLSDVLCLAYFHNLSSFYYIRYVEKLAQSRPLMSDPLDVVKFVCKDFWDDVFMKKVRVFVSPCLLHLIGTCLVPWIYFCQIDKLQTNHRGVFVLSDFKFKWLEKYASDDAVSKETAARMLHFPCGILRGALANMGLASIVVAEFTTLPACTFNIKIKSV